MNIKHRHCAKWKIGVLEFVLLIGACQFLLGQTEGNKEVPIQPAVPGAKTLIELQTDCILLSFEDHGESLTLYVRGRFVQNSGPSIISEDMLNISDEKGISVTAGNKADQKTLDAIRAQIKGMTNQPLRINITTPLYMIRGGIVFLDLKDSGITIASEIKPAVQPTLDKRK